MDSSKDDPRAKQLSTGKKKFNIDPDKVSQMFVFCCTWLSVFFKFLRSQSFVKRRNLAKKPAKFTGCRLLDTTLPPPGKNQAKEK